MSEEEQQLTETILNVINEKKPDTVKQLTNLVKQKTTHQREKKILNCILRLQNEGKIKLTKQPTTVPFEFSIYLTTQQALWYWITIATAIATSITVFATPEDLYLLVYIRYVLGTIFVLWLPGYAFIKTLFPKELPVRFSIKTSNENLDTIERIALSIGMSLALIVGLLLNCTPWGIRQTPIVLSLLLLTTIFATTGIIREHQARTKTTPQKQDSIFLLLRFLKSVSQNCR